MPCTLTVYLKIINSFREECNDLIKSFKQNCYEHFKEFAELFKSKRLGLIYDKYADSVFLYDFKEDSLQIAKEIMLNDNFLGGFYLLYSLYYIQDDPKHYIRLEYNEFEQIKKLIKEDRATLEDTCEPGILFAKLFANEAFAFTYFSRDFCMEELPRAQLFDNNSAAGREMTTFNKEKLMRDFLEGLGITKEFKRVDKAYLEKKNYLKNESNLFLGLDLDLSPEDTIGSLMRSMKERDVTSAAKPPLDIGSRRRLMKKHSWKHKPKFGLYSSIEKNKEVIIKKGRGRPKGSRELYIKTAINDPDDIGESSNSNKNNIILDMPKCE